MLKTILDAGSLSKRVKERTPLYAAFLPSHITPHLAACFVVVAVEPVVEQAEGHERADRESRARHRRDQEAEQRAARLGAVHVVSVPYMMT
jgi:hypothetical protein